MLTPQGEQFGPAYGDFAFGNEETGYQLFVNGERVTDPDNIAYSRTEAEVQLQQKLGLEDYGGTEFKQYVDESLPGGENYREVVFNWDNAPQTHNIGHFDDENQIAHALVRDRTLDDGTSSLHIDELQSDLHTKGSREGYQLPEKLRIEEVNKIEGVLEGTEITMKPPEPLRVPDSTTPSGWRIEHRVHPDAAGKSIFVPLHDPEIASIIGNDIGIGAFPLYQIEGLARELKAGRTSRFGSEAADSLVESLGAEKIYELADLVKPLAEAGPVPDYPFKDNWYEMVLKNLLLDAAREGKPALSVSGSAPIKARYSDEYSKFYEMLYDRKVPSFMKKLANRYGGEFEQGSLDLVDTYGSRNLRGSEVPDFATDNMEANIIRITPEMRARILEEGIPSFGGGGIVDVTQGTDPSTVDRVMRFMNESKAPVPQLGGFNRVALPPEEPKLTPAQAAYIAAQLEPTVITGAADILGGYPEFPSRDVPLSQAFSGEPMPSLIENVREGNLGIAALQSLGAIPGIGAIARAARAGRAVKRSDIVDELIEASYGSQREGIESLARLQRMPESVPLDTYLASQAPSRKIRKKGKTHPARLLRQEVARKRELRRRNPPEVRLYRDLPGRLKDFKIERTARNFTENHPNAQYWYKPDREQIFSDMQDWHHQKTKYNPYPWPEHKQSIKRANLKGLVRKFKKEGWEVDHVSREQGRVSSYYVKKDGNMIRISGHELPMTPQREYDRSRGLTGIWDDEIIVSSDTNIDDVYAETKRLVADWAE